MTERELQEYAELRATIRERGTARVWIAVVGVAAWAAIEVAVATLMATPLGTLVPLLVLAAVFEGIFALHVGVERVGRYLDVFHDDGWEHAAGTFGRPVGAIVVDPLFVVVFVIATALNIVPALLVSPTAEEVIFVGGAHALFVVRLMFAKLMAGKQRVIDRERFVVLKSASAMKSRGHEKTN